MSWETHPSRRRQTLPPDWPARCKHQLKHDNYRCQWGSIAEDKAPYGMCGRKAREVDHYGEGDEHDKLRSLCVVHHQLRSARQGAKASGEARTARAAARFRKPDRHPGLLTPAELLAKHQAQASPPPP